MAHKTSSVNVTLGPWFTAGVFGRLSRSLQDLRTFVC